jgi:IclR family transcriptional regulator, KDG regulon repressor
MEAEADLDRDDRAAPTRAPLRVMQILAELARSREGATLARLSEALEMPKTSLFSLLRSLEAGGYVVSENGHHRLGQEAFSLAAKIHEHDGLTGRVRPILQWLQDECNETVMLAFPAADWSCLIFADVIEPASSLRFIARVGEQRPLYSTAIGLALLAFASPEQQSRYIANTELVRLTPTTITTINALKKTLLRIQKEGYIVASGSVLGVTAVAAPVFGLGKSLACSVSLAGPTTRVGGQAVRLTELVLEASRRMSVRLG